MSKVFLASCGQSSDKVGHTGTRQDDIDLLSVPDRVSFHATNRPETDENLSPNSQFFREGTPEADDGINLPPGSWNKPYSPRSNPFGERPSQRTPGARSFIRRLSTHSSISGGAVTNVMAGVAFFLFAYWFHGTPLSPCCCQMQLSDMQAACTG